ncbi:hypothetical protein Tco_1340263, partial [Tanacetum coccineum]
FLGLEALALSHKDVSNSLSVLLDVVIFSQRSKILPVGNHLRQVLGCGLLVLAVLYTPVEVEGAEFEVTGFNKAFVSPTLGITFEFGKGVTKYNFNLEEEGGFPKIGCFVNIVFALVPLVVSFCSETLSDNWALNVAFS